VWRYLGFVGFALLLDLVFVSVGALGSILSAARSRAFGLSLFIWFFFLLFYDLLAMGITFLLGEHMANLFIFLSVFGNPVDLVRVGSLMLLGDPAIFGHAGAALTKFLGGVASYMVLVAGLLLWGAVPLAVAAALWHGRTFSAALSGINPRAPGVPGAMFPLEGETWGFSFAVGLPISSCWLWMTKGPAQCWEAR